MSRYETHEPDLEVSWPDGHVMVVDATAGPDPVDRLGPADVEASRTDADIDECMVVRLGKYDHFLHASTTRVLSQMVNAHGHRDADVTVHGVTHFLGSATVRALSEELDAVVFGFFGDPLMDPRA